MIKNDNFFTHSDLGLCSLIVSAGHNVEFVKREGRKGIFYFKRDKTIDELADAYWARKPVPVVPAALFEISKHLKAMVDESKQ